MDAPRDAPARDTTTTPWVTRGGSLIRARTPENPARVEVNNQC